MFVLLPDLFFQGFSACRVFVKQFFAARRSLTMFLFARFPSAAVPRKIILYLRQIKVDSKTNRNLLFRQRVLSAAFVNF